MKKLYKNCYGSHVDETVLKSSKLRETLFDTLNSVRAGHVHLIEMYRQPVAALLSIEAYWEFKRLRAAARLAAERKTMWRIVITNVSGGEGKTTLTRELAFALAARGYRVALMDTDPQASLTKSLGLHDDPTSSALTAEQTVLPVFQVTEGAVLPPPIRLLGVDLWPANDELRKADLEITSDISRLGNLRDAVDGLQGYDFLLIDTKPGNTPLLVAALAAADHMVVPVSGIKGLENLDQLGRLAKAARGHAPGIGIRLFIPNRIRAQVNHHKKVLASLEAYQAIAPLAPSVRDSLSVVGGAAEVRQPVMVFKPASDIAQDYEGVAGALLEVLGVSSAAAVAR